MSTHPARADGWHTEHQRIVRDITPHHCPGPNKGILPNSGATDYRRIGTDGGPAAYQGARIQMMAHNLRAWVDDIGEDARRAAEDVILQLDTRIDRDIV